MADAKGNIKYILKELVERTNANTRRLRVLEERSQSVSDLVSTLEETVQKSKKNIDSSIETLTKQVESQNERLESLERSINDVVKQLKKNVTIARMKELEELIEIYNPLKSNFMTREQVEELIEERIR